MHAPIQGADAPRINENENCEFVEFIDNHITCALPDETKYPERSNLESHHHRIFCRMKKGLAWIQWSLGTIRWN